MWLPAKQDWNLGRPDSREAALPWTGARGGKRSAFCDGLLFIWHKLHIYSHFSFSKKKNQKTKTSSFSFVLKTKTLSLPGLGQMLPWQFLVRVTTPPTPVKKKAVDSRTPDLLCGCLFRCPLKGVISTMVLSSGPWMWGVGVTDGVRGLGTEFLYGWA